MPIQGKLFPGQGPDEKIIHIIRKHWFIYLSFLLLAIVMLIPVLAIISYWIFNPDIISITVGNYVILIISSYFLFAMAVFLIAFVDYYLDIYIVSDKRIVSISQDGLFRRQISELHIHQIQDVNAQVTGFFQTFFHFGDVFIQTAGEKENFIFKSIPHPYSTAKTIIDLNEKHIEEDIQKGVEEVENIESSKNNCNKKVEGEITELVKKPLIIEKVTNPNQIISKREQSEIIKSQGRDVESEEEETYLALSKTKKTRQKKKTQKEERGKMDEGKEIDLDENE